MTTIRDLIDRLSTYPPDTPVFAHGDHGGYGPARVRECELVPTGPGIYEAVPGFGVCYPYREGDVLALEIDTARKARAPSTRVTRPAH